MHAGDTGIAHVGQGVLDGLALRIKDGFFRSNDDGCFHARDGGFWAQRAPEASQKAKRQGGQGPVNDPGAHGLRMPKERLTRSVRRVAGRYGPVARATLVCKRSRQCPTGHEWNEIVRQPSAKPRLNVPAPQANGVAARLRPPRPIRRVAISF